MFCWQSVWVSRQDGDAVAQTDLSTRQDHRAWPQIGDSMPAL